jgi:hypothetical protein
LVKRGKLSIEYLAVAILVLAVLFILLLFGGKIREKIIEAVTTFFSETIRGN